MKKKKTEGLLLLHTKAARKSSCLTVLLVALHRPTAHQRADARKGQHLVGRLVQAATADEHGADGIDEIVHGVDVGGQIGPLGHGARGGEKS